MRGIHQWPVNSPHKGPVTRKMFLFDDVIMLIFKTDSDAHRAGSCRKSASTTHSMHSSLTHWPQGDVDVIWKMWFSSTFPVQWRHNERDGVSNHRRHDCLLKRLLVCRSKKTSKLCGTALCEWNPLMTSGSLYRGPVTRKMFPFDDFIMHF